MIEKDEVIAALDRAFEDELTAQQMDWKGLFKVTPQHEKGKSIWAEWLKKELIEPHQVLWAFEELDEPNENGYTRKWLAIRIHRGDNLPEFSVKPEATTFYFNLQSSKDRSLLRQLEQEYREALG